MNRAPKQFRAPSRHLVAVVLVGFAAGVRLACWQWLGTSAPYLTFYPAVIFAALYGGWAAGMLASGLSVLLADYFLIEPIGHWSITSPADRLSLALFFVNCSLISGVTGAMRRARERAAQAEARVKFAADREQAAQALGDHEARLNRILRALSRSSHAMLEAADEAAYMNEVCQNIREIGHALVWIGMAENDPGKTVRVVAHDGFDAGYLDTLHVTWDDAEQGHGPTGTAIRMGVAAICPDMRTDSQFSPWRAEALKRGYRSSIALPLAESGRNFGAVTIYSHAPDAFPPVEVQLLSELAGDLAQGIAALRLRSARKAAEAALGEREEQFRMFVEYAPAAIAMLDKQMRYLAVSRQWLLAYHLEDEAIVGQSHYEVFPEISARWKETHQRCLAGLVESAEEDRFERADGRTQWIRWQIRPWHTAAGEVGGIMIFTEDITARKAAEEMLRLQSTALHSAANAIVIADSNGTIKWVNHAFTKLTGYSTTEAIGRNPRVLKSGQHPPEFYANLWQTIKSDTVWHNEIINKRKDGTFYSEEMTITPVGDAAGAITHFVAIKQDVTERKGMEQTLRESEAKYRSLFETMIEGFCTIEMVFDGGGRPVDYRFLEINPAFEQQTGLQNARGKLIRELVPNHDAHWFETYGKIALTGEPACFENEAKAMGRHYTVSAWRVGGLGSRKVAILFNDISARKLAEARLRRFYETDLFAVLYWKINGGVVDVNDQFLRMTGYTREDLRAGRLNWANLTPPEFQAFDEDARRQVTETGVHLPYEKQFIRKDGSRVWGLFSAAAYADDRTQGVSVILNITERKRAEAALAEAKAELVQKNHELEQRVAERTASLQQALVETERFAYVASHDLQEPLRTVSSFSQLLARRYRHKLDADADEYISFIVEAAARMQTLINDLLALSRIGTRGKLFAPVGCDDILREVQENLGRAIVESGTAVTHDQLPVLVADRTQLAQLFQNLISNAIKFRQTSEPPRIHVSAARQNGGWQLSVRDNGIGIDPQFFERIFIVFQRLHNRDEYPGTGIGLAICKKIVERHGGRLWVESAPGKGSTFHFNLPDRK